MADGDKTFVKTSRSAVARIYILAKGRLPEGTDTVGGPVRVDAPRSNFRDVVKDHIAAALLGDGSAPGGQILGDIALVDATNVGLGRHGIRWDIFGTEDPLVVLGKIQNEELDSRVVIGRFQKMLGLTIEDLSPVLGVSARTLHRRAKLSAPLDQAEGDRAYRLARIADLATEMIGDSDSAQEWLRTPSRYLGARTPISMLATDVGAQLVEQSLFAIGYGGVG